MKGKRNLLIGIILGSLIGWIVGYLRIPFADRSSSFFIGFLSCLAIVLLVISLLFVWNKHSLLIRLIGKDSTSTDSGKAIRTYTLIWILVAVFIVLGGLLSSFLVFRQNELFRIQTQDQNKRIEQQSELIESIRKGNLVFLMSDILDKVDEELKNNPKENLTAATIARIAALSYSFKPYRYLEGDSLSHRRFSPERGQLLLALSIMNIDSISFTKIKLKTTFAASDLSKADLRKADLGQADLREADLSEADLRRADLKGSDMRGANLWGANLAAADLSRTDLKRADLSWANMSGADLSGANLQGAILTSTKLKGAVLLKADFRWADLHGILLIEANMTGADLVGTNMRRANVGKANLSDVDLRYADLSEADLREANLSRADLKFAILNKADLTGADLNGALVEQDWFEKLTEWKLTGAKEIQERYKIVKDTSVQSIYRLALIGD